MQRLRHVLREVSQTDTTLLISGESGTGKSLVARCVHYQSPRRSRPFVEASCVVYTDTLLNSELFGHEKGAFTGAVRQRKGRFELAQGGTLFLDEIGDLKASTQLMLLRVLQDRRFERVGGEETIEVDVRIIAATNQDLTRRVAEGAFREDLFYRLNVFPVEVPPLRARREDIPLLAGRLLERKAGRGANARATVSPAALAALGDYAWPGNVRELENVIEYALVFAKEGVIEADHLPPSVRGGRAAAAPSRRPTLAEHEQHYLRQVLEDCGGNKKLAAQVLGIERSTLYSKLRRYGLSS